MVYDSSALSHSLTPPDAQTNQFSKAALPILVNISVDEFCRRIRGSIKRSLVIRSCLAFLLLATLNSATRLAPLLCHSHQHHSHHHHHNPHNYVH